MEVTARRRRRHAAEGTAPATDRRGAAVDGAQADGASAPAVGAVAAGAGSAAGAAAGTAAILAATAAARGWDRLARLPGLPGAAGLAVPLRWRRWVPGPWALAVVLLVALLSVPILVVAAGLLRPAGPTWAHLAETVLAGYVANTLVLVGGAGALALLLGVPSAWLVATCEFPGRRVFSWALVLPLAVPAYIAAFAYTGLLDVTGPVQRVVRLAPGFEDFFLHWNVRRIETAVLVFAFVLYPYVYLLARAAFERQSRAVLEASRSLGRPMAETFFRVALPLARPAVVAGVALVAMEVLNDYGLVNYFGVATFTTGIFRAWFAMGDLGAALRLAGVLMLIVFALLALERVSRGRARYENGRGGDRPLARFPLRGWRAAAAVAACFTPVFFGFLVPFAQLVYWARGTAGRVLEPAFLRLAANSLGLALAAAAATVLVGLVLAYGARVSRGTVVRRLARLSVLGYSIPGAVVAVGVLVALGATDRAVDRFALGTLGVSTGLLLSGTLVAVMFAYAVRFMAVAFSSVEAGLERVCGEVDAASRALGAAPLRTLRRVTLPLLRGTLAGAVLLVFVDVLKELPLTLILRPFNFDTLATKAFQLASIEQVAESAVPALLIIAAGVLPVVLLSRLIPRSHR
jgi:iron(III) transport system permease protein